MRRILTIVIVAGLAAVFGGGIAHADVINREVVSATFNVPGGGWDKVVNCPTSKVSLGGGYTIPSARLFVDISRPSTAGQGWHVHVLNPTAVTFQVQVYVVCGATAGREVVTTTFNVPANAGGDGIAACPAGKVNTGGGYFHTSNTAIAIDINRPALAGQGWHVHALNGSAVVQPITAYTVCATTPGRQVVSATVFVLSGQTVTITATCPAGKVNTGGGFFHGSNKNIRIRATRPAAAGQAWQIEVSNFTPAVQPVTSYAVCATGT